MANKITKEQITHIANLAQIQLGGGEDEKFAKFFSETLDYINILNKLNTKGVSETYQVTGLKNVFQKEGNNTNSLTQKEALSNASEVIDNLIATKGVFDR